MERKNPKQSLNLPQEIIEEILSRLPVKPLLKFRRVSKPWRSLIDSKRFMNLHFRNSTKNKEDLWLWVFRVGTECNFDWEWDELYTVSQYKWNFSNLEEALEEGGELHNMKVYLFAGCTEFQLFPYEEDQSILRMVVSPFPPSDKIAIKSIWGGTVEIVPMKQMDMDWVPYIPLENRESQVERLKNSQIFILSWNQSRPGLRPLKKFECCLPYFYNPLHEDELEQSTVVDLLFPIDPKPVICEFDWELDELEHLYRCKTIDQVSVINYLEFTDKLIEDEELPADQKEPFENYVKEKIREAKKAKRESRRKARDELNQQEKAAFENMKFYKFYGVPTPDTPGVSDIKSAFINGYYGNTHKVI